MTLRRMIPFLIGGVIAPGLCVADPFIPNDPRVGAAWHVEKLRLPEAWGYSLGDSSVIAAVLDTGVMANTPDLQGRLLPAVAPVGTAPVQASFLFPA